MRGLVPGLRSPHPLAQALPAVYQEEDPFTVQFTTAFDDALAPVVSTLDNLDAYFDPQLTPEDFLGWLAGWVAFELDETWPLDRRREAVGRAVDLLRRRGTIGGLADEVAMVTGGEVDVIDNGGTAWSIDPASEMVGSPAPGLLVRVRVANPSSIDTERLDRLVRAAKPAHVPHRLEVVGGGGSTARPTKKGATEPPVKPTPQAKPPAKPEAKTAPPTQATPPKPAPKPPAKPPERKPGTPEPADDSGESAGG